MVIMLHTHVWAYVRAHQECISHNISIVLPLMPIFVTYSFMRTSEPCPSHSGWSHPTPLHRVLHDPALPYCLREGPINICWVPCTAKQGVDRYGHVSGCGTHGVGVAPLGWVWCHWGGRGPFWVGVRPFEWAGLPLGERGTLVRLVWSNLFVPPNGWTSRDTT